MNKVIIAALLTGAGAFSPAFAAENSNDSYLYRGECPSPAGGAMKVDKWSFYKCECTSAAASFLNERGIPFTNFYRSVRWSNASNWISAAKLSGLKVDKTAKIGDIAIINGNHASQIKGISGDSISLREYNYSRRWDFSERTIKTNSVTGIIHF